MSQSSLQRLFRLYLTQAPTVEIKSKDKAHLLIDATYFPNNLCLVLYYDHDIRYTQLYRFTDGERYDEIHEDLLNLKKLGVDVASITCDGHKALLKAIRKAYPGIKVQRCLVHIKRQGQTWLTQRPQSQAGRELLAIVKRLTGIRTLAESSDWLIALHDWDRRHKTLLAEKSVSRDTGRYWYKHKMLRKVRTLLVKAVPNMFHYLDDASIPYTTNRLESFFGHLKDKLTLHRGLRPQAKGNFIKWYLHFKNNKK